MRRRGNGICAIGTQRIIIIILQPDSLANHYCTKYTRFYTHICINRYRHLRVKLGGGKGGRFRRKLEQRAKVETEEIVQKLLTQ